MPSLTQLTYQAVQQPLLVVGLLFVASWLVLRSQPHRQRALTMGRRYGSTAVGVAAGGIVGVYLSVIVWYLMLPSFAGQVEPMIASVSWLLGKGQPLYHALDAPERYSALYGPMVYVFNALALHVLGPSMVSAKLAGTLAAVFALLFLFLALDGLTRRRVALGYVSLAVLLYFIHGPFSFLSRPDPFLLLWVSFALLCSVRARQSLALLGVAAAMAVGIDLKIHSILYFLPMLGILEYRFGLHTAGTAGLLGVLLSGIPFLFPTLSARNYIAWLREASRHGLEWSMFFTTLKFALFFMLPALVFVFPVSRIRPVLKEHRIFFGACIVTVVCLLVVASKPGAGLPHLLPLVPTIIYASLVLVRAQRRAAGGTPALLTSTRLSAVTAYALTAVFIGSIVEYKLVNKVTRRAERAVAVTKDLHQIMENYPDAKVGMAYGGQGLEYEDTFYRPALVFAGNPVLIDCITVMEGERSGRPIPQTTYDAVASGQIHMWLVPRDSEPFTLRNWYPPHNRLFSEEFIALFKDRYAPMARSEFFDLWIWKDFKDLDARFAKQLSANLP